MTDSGKAMPIDPQPDPNGNIVATKVARGKYANGRYVPIGQELPPGDVRLMQHWYTCADPTKPGKPRRKPVGAAREPPPPEPLFDYAPDEPPCPF